MVVPVANFAASITTAYDDETVTFMDMSSNSPSSWVWSRRPWTSTSELDYVVMSSSQHPSGIVIPVGTWDIKLRAGNDDGYGTEVKSSYITVLSKSYRAQTLSQRGLVYHRNSASNQGVSVTVPAGRNVERVICSYSGSPTNATLVVSELLRGASNLLSTVMTHYLPSAFTCIDMKLPSSVYLDQRYTLSSGGPGIFGRLTVITSS